MVKIELGEMNKETLHKMRPWVALLFLVVCGPILLVSCGVDSRSTITEVVPNISPVTNDPVLHKYVSEFSQLAPKAVQLTEPSIPFARNLIRGSIDAVDYNTNCSLWLIQSHAGSNHFDGQKLYLYSDKSQSLSEVAGFAGKRVENAIILSDWHGGDPFVLASIWPSNSEWWFTELWTNNLRSGVLLHLTDGGDCKVSPDHSHVAFWRRDSEGFYSLHIWDVHTGSIENVISMWERDPGSGTSWNWNWSVDSKALHIQGTCGGFLRRGKRERKEINLIYLVASKQMFQTP